MMICITDEAGETELRPMNSYDAGGFACVFFSVSCATQGEKAAIIKELRSEGFQLKYLLKAMPMTKSTYYFEISKEDVVAERNKDLMQEINEIFTYNKA